MSEIEIEIEIEKTPMAGSTPSRSGPGRGGQGRGGRRRGILRGILDRLPVRLRRLGLPYLLILPAVP